MHLRHSGKAECLFGDGHIDAVNEKYEYLGNTTLYWYMGWYNSYNNTYGNPPY
jgi:prepilin-type processing-associated H-X9-DG protein